MIVWDTSALLPAFERSDSRYARARGILVGDPKHGGSLLLRAELRCGLMRRAGTRPSQVRQVEAWLRGLWDGFHLIALDADQAHLAEELAARHSLRGADAVHLAAALTLAWKLGKSGVRLVSGDHEQLSAARKEGLRVIGLLP